jgi:hypothetical protein
MSLLDQAKEDIESITSDPEEWGRSILFEAPGGETATVVGLHSKHHLGFDTDGLKVNSKNAHLSVSETLLLEQNYPVRNSQKQVAMRNHKVTVIDSTGESCVYHIKETYPNETIGLIVCVLVDYA